jgi:hypothetical protein
MKTLHQIKAVQFNRYFLNFSFAEDVWWGSNGAAYKFSHWCCKKHKAYQLAYILATFDKAQNTLFIS